MKSSLLFACVASSMMLTAQNVVVGTPQPLLKGVEAAAYSPVISGDGTQMLFCTDENRGLKLYSFVDEVSETIEPSSSIVYNARFNADGSLDYQKSQFTGKVYARKRVAFENGKKAEFKTVKNSVSAYAKFNKIEVNVGGAVKLLDPVCGCMAYLNASVSPDGQHIVFQAAGKGVFVADLNGNIKVSLGHYEFPVWCGNDYVAVQKSTDDGYQLQSSHILLLGIDGEETVQVTPPTSMGMNPSATADGTKLVYNTVDGRLFVVNLTFE